MPVSPLDPEAPFLVAGSDTLAGRALVEELERRGARRILTLSCDEIDPLAPERVETLFARERPRLAVVAAGRSGGIGMNRRRPASLMRGTLAAATLVIDAAARHGVTRLLFLASSCCYPRSRPEPMGPELFGSGELEPTSRPYALARLAAAEYCLALRRERGCDFVVGVPSHPFGPGDSFDPEEAHVVPSLIARFEEARRAGAPRVVLWGTGTPRRDLIFSRDLATAALAVLERYEGAGPVNLGCGMEISIRELAVAIARVTGYEGEIRFDPAHPDGAPVKTLDAGELFALGWRPAWPLDRALELTYRDYCARRDRAAGAAAAGG